MSVRLQWHRKTTSDVRSRGTRHVFGAHGGEHALGSLREVAFPQRGPIRVMRRSSVFRRFASEMTSPLTPDRSMSRA